MSGSLSNERMEVRAFEELIAPTSKGRSSKKGQCIMGRKRIGREASFDRINYDVHATVRREIIGCLRSIESGLWINLDFKSLESNYQ